MLALLRRIINKNQPNYELMYHDLRRQFSQIQTGLYAPIVSVQSDSIWVDKFAELDEEYEKLWKRWNRAQEENYDLKLQVRALTKLIKNAP